MPILDGFILAWLMCPLVNAIEHFALYPARDWLISPKTVLTEKKETADQLLPRHFDRPDAVLCPVFVYGFFRVVIPQIIGSIQSIVGQFPAM